MEHVWYDTEIKKRCLANLPETNRIQSVGKVPKICTQHPKHLAVGRGFVDLLSDLGSQVRILRTNAIAIHTHGQ